MSKYESEQDVCRRIVEWLQSQHWEVYQEVSLGYASRRADIVAKMGTLLWIIEVKRSMSMALLEQSLQWIGYANIVSVATLGGKRQPRNFLNWFSRQSGIGMITVCPISDEARVLSKPRLYRVKHDRVLNRLCDEQKSFCSAGTKGGYWTPYAETCREVLSRVKREPGITMKRLMDGLSHHYQKDSTARACISKWAELGKIPGVRVERCGRENRFFPTEGEER